MPEIPERFTTTSLNASAEKITESSRITRDSSSIRVSASYRPDSISGSAVEMASSGMSVMKPSRPWLTPITGTSCPASWRASPSSVPSPPSTTATSASRPISSGSAPGNLSAR
jgi:hypothetical protein